MQLTITVTVCHIIAGISAPVCREEIVLQDDMSMQACMIGQPAIADWKAHSIYRGDQWSIARIKCIPGSAYVIKDRV